VVTVTVPVRDAVVVFAVTKSVIVVLAAHEPGATVNHEALEVADQACWLELTTTPVLCAVRSGSQVVRDSVRFGGIAEPPCVTTKAAEAPPAVTVTVPVLGDDTELAVVMTVIRAPPGPVAGETVSHAASLAADH